MRKKFKFKAFLKASCENFMLGVMTVSSITMWTMAIIGLLTLNIPIVLALAGMGYVCYKEAMWQFDNSVQHSENKKGNKD